MKVRYLSLSWYSDSFPFVSHARFCTFNKVFVKNIYVCDLLARRFNYAYLTVFETGWRISVNFQTCSRITILSMNRSRVKSATSALNTNWLGSGNVISHLRRSKPQTLDKQGISNKRMIITDLIVS